MQWVRSPRGSPQLIALGFAFFPFQVAFSHFNILCCLVLPLHFNPRVYDLCPWVSPRSFVLWGFFIILPALARFPGAEEAHLSIMLNHKKLMAFPGFLGPGR